MKEGKNKETNRSNPENFVLRLADPVSKLDPPGRLAFKYLNPK